MKKDTLRRMATLLITVTLVFVLGIPNLVQASGLPSSEETNVMVDDDYDPGGWPNLDPRYVCLQFKEPYNGTNVAEMFPEIGILNAKELNESFYRSIVKMMDESEYFASLVNLKYLEKIKNEIGMYFTIELVDASRESVFYAIYIMQQHPLVSYAGPCNLPMWFDDIDYDDYYDWLEIEPGYINVLLKEPYFGTNPISLFPEIKIIEMTDVGENGKDYLIKLASGTKRAVVDTIDLLSDHPLVSCAAPVFITSPSDPNFIKINVGHETGGGAGFMRVIEIDHGSSINLEGKYIMVRILNGYGINTDINVITINALKKAIVSYTKSNSIVDVWLTDGHPDLRGAELGVKVFATARGN